MEYPIPAASMQRLLAAYQQFETLAQIIAETLGVPPGPRQVDFDCGVFVTPELSHNGSVTHEEVEELA